MVSEGTSVVCFLQLIIPNDNRMIDEKKNSFALIVNGFIVIGLSNDYRVKANKKSA
jgi:hypothetical protein